MKNAFHNFTPFIQVLFLVVVGFFSFAVFSMLISSIVGAIYYNLPLNDVHLLMEKHAVAFMVLFYVPIQVGFFLVPGVLYYYLEPASFNRNLLGLRDYRISLIWSVLLFLSLFLLLPFLSELNIEITKWLGVFEQLTAAKVEADATLVSLFGEQSPQSHFVWAIIIIGVLTGVAEEFAFRGFLLRHLIRTTGKTWLAILMSGLVFALLHFNYLQILPLIAFGIALGMIFVLTKSVWLGIVLHASNNIINITWLHQGRFPNWMEESTVLITVPTIVLLIGLLIWKRKSLLFSS